LSIGKKLSCEITMTDTDGIHCAGTRLAFY